MRKVMLIPTYWMREKSDGGWREGDAVYDHPTPIDEQGTLQRTLESIKLLQYKDFKLVLLVCPTTPAVAERAEAKVTDIVRKADVKVETYIFTVSDLERISDIIFETDRAKVTKPLLTMYGYAHVRNMCLLCADILAADAAILIDDDEVFEKADWVERSVEFLGKRIYGDVVYGMAGYYLNKKDQYYDDVVPRSWMTYWDRFGAKARAFDEIIGCEPRIKRTPFVFGGAMILHRNLFQSVPFDPHISRGEDIDYLINSRMYGFSFFLDNTLSIKHLPEPKSEPVWKRIREDIVRFVYQREKISSQYKTSNMVIVTPEDFDPYPGEFLKDDLSEKIFRSNMMLANDYMQNGDVEGAAESLNNISISRKDAVPNFDAFSRYRSNQKLWEQICGIVAKNRYQLRKIMEEHNLSKGEIIRNEQRQRQMTPAEIVSELKNAFDFELSEEDWSTLSGLFHVKTYYEEEIMFKSGDFNSAMYSLLKGEMSLFSSSPGGEVEVARLVKGDILGESCMNHSPFTLSCRAVQFTELICIEKENIQKLVDTYPELGVKFYQQVLVKVVEKLRVSNSHILSMAGEAVRDEFVDDRK